MFNKLLSVLFIVLLGSAVTCTFLSLGIVQGGVLILSIFFIFQALFTLFWMLYAWENPHDADKHKSPSVFHAPKVSFSILLPAKQEEGVIGDTILAMDRIKYPAGMCEIILLIREEDLRTLSAAKDMLKRKSKHIFRIVLFHSGPVNKPHALNVGLSRARGSIVAVFDAEDEPHEDILNVANTIFSLDNPDVIQSGVQLMNYGSRWYSLLSVLEYFLWFKSGLLFFATVGKTTPLGGNTVFFKKSWLDRVGGWDEKCLTEDAEVGIRMSALGARTRVVYDPVHVTREETPGKVSEFIKQRTRWNQGFLQVLMKGEWLLLPGIKSKSFAFYILFSPYFQSLLIFVSPFLVYFSFTERMPIIISIVSIIPLYLFFIQIVVQIIASYEFMKDYKYSYSIFTPVKIVLTFIPYQMMLVISCVRSLWRSLLGRESWEKTFHENLHRQSINSA